MNVVCGVCGRTVYFPTAKLWDRLHPDSLGASSIVGSHTLIPDALYHAFSTFGALMSPDLPLHHSAMAGRA
jgi:hypothetical protein